VPAADGIVPVDLAGIAAATGFLVIAAFQAALALGAPLGRAAWGGKTAVLPGRLRRASAVALVVWVLAAALILGRAGVVGLPVPREVLTWGAWALTVLSGLGALVNVASSSPWERFGWAPLAAVLAILSAIVALSPA
jgi:hypothetical protein